MVLKMRQFQRVCRNRSLIQRDKSDIHQGILLEGRKEYLPTAYINAEQHGLQCPVEMDTALNNLESECEGHKHQNKISHFPMCQQSQDGSGWSVHLIQAAIEPTSPIQSIAKCNHKFQTRPDDDTRMKLAEVIGC